MDLIKKHKIETKNIICLIVAIIITLVLNTNFGVIWNLEGKSSVNLLNNFAKLFMNVNFFSNNIFNILHSFNELLSF